MAFAKISGTPFLRLDRVVMKQIGFFGGSFDPIHFGHLKMAKELKEKKMLDEVWFSPARISPFKLDRCPESVENRLEMLRLALGGEPGFKIYEEESRRLGPSYSIETVEHLSEIPDSQFYFIISDESVPEFFHWKEAERIVQLVPLIVGSRVGAEPPKKGNKTICQAMERGWTPTQILDISSTQIRKFLKEGKDCTSYIPRNVLDFIYQNHLYSSTNYE